MVLVLNKFDADVIYVSFSSVFGIPTQITARLPPFIAPLIPCAGRPLTVRQATKSLR